jgi:hypothetical protein
MTDSSSEAFRQIHKPQLSNSQLRRPGSYPYERARTDESCIIYKRLNVALVSGLVLADGRDPHGMRNENKVSPEWTRGRSDPMGVATSTLINGYFRLPNSAIFE